MNNREMVEIMNKIDQGLDSDLVEMLKVSCVCRKCGEAVNCSQEHSNRNDPHIGDSMCGRCAG